MTPRTNYSLKIKRPIKSSLALSVGFFIFKKKIKINKKG